MIRKVGPSFMSQTSNSTVDCFTLLASVAWVSHQPITGNPIASRLGAAGRNRASCLATRKAQCDVSFGVGEHLRCDSVASNPGP